MQFILEYWPVISFFTALLIGQWGTTLLLKKEMATVKTIFEIQLNNINEKLAKQNGRVSKNELKIDNIEHNLGKHVETFHAKR